MTRENNYVHPKYFPIHSSDREVLPYVPWRVVAPHRKQALKNHYQSLESLARRGGLSLCELAAVLEDRPWQPMTPDKALEVVNNFLAKEVNDG